MSRALPPHHLHAFMPRIKKFSVYVAICVTVLITNNYRSASKLRSAPLIKRYAVEQSVETLRYKPEGRVFNSR